MSGSLVGGRYLLGDLLGAGGTAAVFRAVDTRGEAVVAVKVLHAHLATVAAAAERFLLEAQASTGLTHRNLVPVLDSGQDGPLVWLAQELVDGVTLAELVAATGPLPQADALAVLAGVLAGLTHAHVRGVLHLDLSSSNVMIPWARPDGLDLAGARVLDLGGRPMPSSVGFVRVSPGFASPEVATAGEVGASADLYSAGALLLFMLTGRAPFDGPDPRAVLTAQVHDAPPVPSSLVEGVSAEVDALVARALSKEPPERHATATAMGVDVARARGALRSRVVRGSTLDLPVAAAVARPDHPPAQPVAVTAVAARDRLGDGVPRQVRPAGRMAAVLVLAVTGALVATAAAVGPPRWAQGAPAASTVTAVAATVEPTPRSSPSPSAPPDQEPSPTPTAATQTAVPVLTALSRADAQAALLAAGLVEGEVTQVDGPAGADVVVRAVPADGTLVAPGTVVAVTVASGMTTVPAVVGLGPGQASEALAAAGLAAGSAGIGGARVLTTRPAAGSRVAVGTVVDLTLEPAPSATPPAPSATPSADPSASPSAPSSDPNG